MLVYAAFEVNFNGYFLLMSLSCTSYACYSLVSMSLYAEFLSTEKSHVKTLKTIFLKFYEVWPCEHITLRNAMMPKFEEIIAFHSTHCSGFSIEHGRESRELIEILHIYFI